jgi:UDP-N-acetylmuramoyl-tripeptide--D-alanyl-D-alanine ligase
MLEVGELSEAEHEYAIQIATSLGMSELYLVGDEFKKVTKSFPTYSTVEELKADLANRHLSGRTILIKGSRKNKLEEIVGVL